MRLLLHFGAVDQTAYVYVDGKEVMTHVGGYLPFTLDLTPFAKESRADALDLVVKVKDVSDTSYHARGKQKLQRGGMYSLLKVVSGRRSGWNMYRLLQSQK